MKKIFLSILAVFLVITVAYAVTVPVFKDGTKTDTVPASEKIAVYAPGTAKLYYKVGYPNFPGTYKLLATVTGKEYVSSAFSTATEIKIEADARGAFYDIDSTPDVLIPGPSVYMISQGSPSADTTNDTLTVQELLSGIITYTGTSGANATLTLPLGTSMDASSDAVFGIDQSFDWHVINLSTTATNSCTITANTGHTLVGVGEVIASDASGDGEVGGPSATFRSRKTAANTWITYRIN
jgi:hypothetical protein